MKFLCICMSPAIDATVTLPRAPQGAGEIFKDVAEEENVGGKAVNVARWLAIRGAAVACGGLLGEDNDRPFVRELANYAIEDRFVRVPGATRRNEMIVWPGGSVKLNRAAFPGLAAVPSLDALLPLSSVTPPAVAILSGSLPPAVPTDFYAAAVARLKSLGLTVVLDASGAALAAGVRAH
ncbi:MAG: 1-phosphofructokinase, partial [Kiritimatiellae bacterium]|nr:1-phosphofructokinase [Kiritimatiellia bacterium]